MDPSKSLSNSQGPELGKASCPRRTEPQSQRSGTQNCLLLPARRISGYPCGMRHHIFVRLAGIALALLLSLVAAHQSAFAQPSKGEIAKAKKHMAAGVAFIQDPDGARYEEAYPEFKGAYELSGSLNALQNLAICAMKLELDGEAIEHFEEFLEKKGDDIDAADKADVERDLNALKAAVAWITVSADKPGITLKDIRTPRSGATKRNQYTIGLQAKRLGVHPGDHAFTAITGEGKELKWNLVVKNGDAHTHDFLFDPGAPVTAEGFTEDDANFGDTDDEEDDEGGGMPAYVWIAGSITVAAAVPWAIFGIMSFGKKSDYDAIHGQVPVPEQQEAFDDLQTTNLLADIFMGVTAAGAVATIILAITAPSGEEDAEEEAGVNWTIAPSVDPRGGAAAMITGTF